MAMAIGRKTRTARAKRSQTPPSERGGQAATERSASTRTHVNGGRPALLVIETIGEESGSNQRAEKLVDILSEAVCACLKHKGRGARNRRLGAPKIELTTAGNRAGIGTEGGVGSVHVTEALGARVKA